MTSLAADPQRRAQIIRDTRILLDELEADPSIPIWRHGIEIQYGPEDGRAGVRRIARQLGEQPEIRGSGALRAVHRVGLAAYILYAQPEEQAQDAPGSETAA